MKVEITVSQSPLRDARDLAVSAEIANDGPEPARLNAAFLAIPSVVLQVRDGSGRRVAPPPPPVPPPDDGEAGHETLGPGETLSFEYNGGALFGMAPTPGTYSVRFHYRPGDARANRGWHGTLESDWTDFTVGGKHDR